MAKREKKTATAAIDNTASDNQSAEKSEMELANEQAIKDAEAAAATKQTEEEKAEPEADVIPDGACEVYGQVDLNSRACKSCPVLEQCKAKSKAAGVKLAKEKKEGGTRAPRVKTGEVSRFSQSDLGRQNGKIDKALETPHTMAELTAITECSESRIRSHIKWLKQNRAETCYAVEEGGKIHFVLK